MKRSLLHILVLILAFLALAIPSPAEEGQTVIIDRNVSHIVYSNGMPPGGTGQLAQSDAEDYHVIVNSGGVASGDIYDCTKG